MNVCVTIQTIVYPSQRSVSVSRQFWWRSRKEIWMWLDAYGYHVSEARWEDGLHDGVLEHKLHLGGYFENFVMSVVESRQFHCKLHSPTDPDGLHQES